MTASESPVRVEQVGPALLVVSPYDARFVEGAKRLGGRWDPSARVWSVPLQQRAQLRVLLLDAYKHDGGLPAEAAPEAPLRPATALPSVADLEQLVSRYTVPGVVSMVGPPSGPIGAA